MRSLSRTGRNVQLPYIEQLLKVKPKLATTYVSDPGGIPAYDKPFWEWLAHEAQRFNDLEILAQ
jgi:hypothetical protein